eukprot:scaffold41026_cov18-Tisochrysis_lutea.AAC.1
MSCPIACSPPCPHVHSLQYSNVAYSPYYMLSRPSCRKLCCEAVWTGAGAHVSFRGIKWSPKHVLLFVGMDHTAGEALQIEVKLQIFRVHTNATSLLLPLVLAVLL